jgi:hypothetical protein
MIYDIKISQNKTKCWHSMVKMRANVFTKRTVTEQAKCFNYLCFQLSWLKS